MKIKYLKLKYGRSFYQKSIFEMEEESKSALNKITNGVPLHQVLGYIEMTNVKINLSNKVLIPRYETEELVLLVSKYANKDTSILDLCTGSGYIAIAIKSLTGASLTASDISDDAIKQAKENAKINNLEINFLISDLFENIKGKFDIIIANPPYIPTKNNVPNSVLNHEPYIALFGGEDGNDYYRKICNEYKNYLKDGGKIFLEISSDNEKFILSKKFKIIKDINSKTRIAYK